MKSAVYSVLVLFLFAIPEVASVESDLGSTPTSVIDLSSEWSFAYTADHTGEVPETAAFKISMPVPSCWDDHLNREQASSLWKDAHFNTGYQEIKYPLPHEPHDASLPYLVGSGWYLKKLEVPGDWHDRKVTLRIGRVVMEAWLYVNGHQVAHHMGHSTSWEVPLAPHLKFDQTNEIVLAVANTRNNRTGSVIRGWKGRSGGIFGPVSIKVAGQARIADLFVHLNQGKLEWRVESDGLGSKGAELKWEVRNPKTGESLGQGSTAANGNNTRWTTPTLDIPVWSDAQPNLVEIEVSLWRAGTCLDLHRQPFGLRKLTRHGVGLQLNGEPVYLRGVCEIAYFPETCTPPLQIDWYRKHIRRLKELGFNWLRFHTWVPTEPYLQAADELGMLIQVEPPWNHEIGEWRDIMRFCRKHPSVVIYCSGNEQLIDEAAIEFLHQCADELRQSVPDALYNPQEGMRGIEYGLDGIEGTVQEPFPHHPARLAKVKEFTDVFGQYTLGLLSYNTLLGNQSTIDERLAIYDRPCLGHELGIIGCYLDLNLEQRYANTRIGPDLFSKARKYLDQAGLLERADRYYRNSAAWQRLIRKDAIELTRKCRLFSGYDLLGANDGHWHRTGYSCGVLNEFEEMKPGDTVADVLGYNGESVLLIGQQRIRNLQAGKLFTRELLVSWFATDTLREGALRWRIETPDGEVLGSGEQEVETVEPGQVQKIATIDTTIPSLDQPTKVTLIVELSGERSQIDNHWDYWIFPAAPAVGKSNATVVSSLSARNLQQLVHGARVVLIGHKPFPAASTSFQIGSAGRGRSNLATVIAKHPLTDRFPHDGYCDWQFSHMLEDGGAVLFDDIDIAFDPILEVVSSYKRIIKQAALFEWRVGRGRLLVCTLKLPETDPAAMYLRHLLIDYAASDQFEPHTTVDPKQLARLLKMDPSELEQLPETDRAFNAAGQLIQEEK